MSLIEARPSPLADTGSGASKLRSALTWMRTRLFATPFSALITIGCLYLIYLALPPLVNWAILSANWIGQSEADCTRDGACWAFVGARFGQFVFGFYPDGERWRVVLAGALLVAAGIPVAAQLPGRRPAALFLIFVFPFVGFFLLRGGLPGLPIVDTNLWGGLMLTLVLATVSIALSLPLGILLALGRRSKMRIVKMVCVGVIEFVRGVPLISVLFMAAVMLPLFLPEGVNVNKLLRALVGISIFAAAYMAEVVRGGLQAVPAGQYEGARAMGLGYWQMMRLVVLPQALSISVPSIVNTYISLFKDTSLVLVIGLLDFLNIVKITSTDPHWLGIATEGYVFAAVVYWVFCFSMSRYSRWIEKRISTGRTHG